MGISTFIGKMLGNGVIEGATGVANIVDKFMETPDEKRAAEIVNRKLQLRPDELQAEINKIEAGHRSLFVAGARPFIMWVCGFGFACHFLVFPIGDWVLRLLGYDIAMPALDSKQLMTLIYALLGLGSLRTYEKQKGLTK